MTRISRPAPSPQRGEGRGEGVRKLEKELHRPRSSLFAPRADACICRTCSPILAARFVCVRVLPKATLTKSLLKRGVERREAPGSWATPRGRMLPPAHASGVARATEQSACANRLLRARCASRRSTTIAVLRHGCRPPCASSAPAPSAGIVNRRPYGEREDSLSY